MLCSFQPYASSKAKKITKVILLCIAKGFSDELGNKKYNVANVEYYLVDDKFPALRESDIKSEAINNVGYELILKLLIDYLVK